MPKRTYSLDWKGSYFQKRANSQQCSATSMIPRLDRKRYLIKLSAPYGVENRIKTAENVKETDSEEPNLVKVEGDHTPSTELSEVENIEVSEDFLEFKKNVMKIPEYWTETGNTVTNILKNAENAIAKQYPTADMKTFENELKNIQAATKAAKEEIVKKAEKIINRANKIYCNEDECLDEEEMQAVAQKMEEIKQEMEADKSIFNELLKCGGEIKQMIESGKERLETPRERSKSTRRNRADIEKEDGNNKRTDNEKPKYRGETDMETKKKGRVKFIQSCGDGQSPVATPRTNSSENPTKLEDKTTQTINLLTLQLYCREQAFHLLNDQILELQQLCKDYISKFKNFNLQIKLRGMCSKSQSISTSKELQILHEEKQQIAENNQKLISYNRELQSMIKQKEMDIYQKDKIIGQQKKLLLVRDELIEMLKSKINLGDVEEL